MPNAADDLAAAKNRTWFYRFELPDGTQTTSDIPAEVDQIHKSRRDKLRWVIAELVDDSSRSDALDLASHEGYFSVELARHFSSVRGLEIRDESIEAARLITRAMGAGNVSYQKADLQTMRSSDCEPADFVLLYGLLYHLENPIHTLRLASELSRKYILIETQIFPYDVAGKVEDGHYRWQRDVHGVFCLSMDDTANREGGSTDIALVPSLNALLHLMRTFGFRHVEVLASPEDDYEQFRRGSRVVVFGRKA